MGIWKRILLVGWIIVLLFGGQAGPAAAETAPAWPAPIDPPLGGGLFDAGKIDKEKKITVDISEQRVTASQGGVVVMRFPVSTGRNGNTAVGSFRILDKRLAPKHARWGYSMPYWMGVYWVGRDWENGFHALPVTESGRELWGDLIGTPASDGCIVLRPADMHRLYAWAEVGTPVEIVE